MTKAADVRRNRLLRDVHQQDDKPTGRCRFCGGEVQKPRRTFCSGGFQGFEPDVTRPQDFGCVEKWRTRSQPDFARRVVFARDGGRCAGCGVETPAPLRKPWRGPWHLDHRVPLFRGGMGDLPNLQTLCHACHKAKTIAERTVDPAQLKL